MIEVSQYALLNDILGVNSTFQDALTYLDKAGREGKLDKLHEVVDGEVSIWRPLTIKETINALVESYDSDNKLTSENLDTCSAIAYSPDCSKFKIISNVYELTKEDIMSGQVYTGWGHGRWLYFIDYDNLKGNEFYLKSCSTEPLKSESDYDYSWRNFSLTKEEVLENPIWLALVDGDKALLENYTKTVFSKSLKEAMGFDLQIPPWETEIDPACRLEHLNLGRLTDETGKQPWESRAKVSQWDLNFTARFLVAKSEL